MTRLRHAALAVLVLFCAREASAAPQALWTLGWGSGVGEVGRQLPSEAAPEGPMSFAVDAKGRVFLLDQIHGRIQIIDRGTVTRVIPLPGDGYQDLALAPDGTIWLLDRLADRRLDRLAADGRWLSTMAVEGGPVTEAGAITALFVQLDGVWVELEHSRLVRLADLDGSPDRVRPVVQGRLSGDRKQRLLAARDGHRGLGLFARPASHPGAPTRLLAALELENPLLEIAALESDPQGRVILALQSYRSQQEPPHDIVEVHEQVLWFSPAGEQLAAVRVPARTGPEEQFRAYRMGLDGQLYLLHLDDSGATLWGVQP